MKTRLSLILALIIVLSSFTGVFASNFQDAGEILKEIGVLTGNTEGDLMLDEHLNRQDMVVLLSRFYQEEDIAKDYQAPNIFKDLGEEAAFYIPYINWAKDQNLIQGIAPDRFGYGQETSVQEFQTVLVRVLDYKDQAGKWDEIPEFSKQLGLMEGLKIDGSSKLTRGQMAQMIVNALDIKLKDSQETLAKKLDLTIEEVFKSGFQIDGKQIEFRGKAPRSKTIQIEVRPKNQPESTKISDLKLDENKNFGHLIESLDPGDYEYRLIGDRYRTLFVGFKIGQEVFPEDDLEIEEKTNPLIVD